MYLQESLPSFIQNRDLIFFGDPNYSVLENLVILIAKKYIYNAKCNDYNISMKGFRNMLQTTEKIEKQIALKHDKLHIHDEKWSPLLPL